MKKKLRKNTQTSLINIKGAGRPAIHDPGIRHSKRTLLKKPSSLHLTVKVRKDKSFLKNKQILNILKRAILNARRQGLRVIHYSLEYDHVHLLIEADNNHTLGKGMQSFGVTMAKAINRIRGLRGSVYKHRYHFRQILSPRQLKNVMNYIFTNGVKHRSASTIDNPYNSIRAEINYCLFTKEKIEYDLELMGLLDKGKIFYQALEFI